MIVKILLLCFLMVAKTGNEHDLLLSSNDRAVMLSGRILVS